MDYKDYFKNDVLAEEDYQMTLARLKAEVYAGINGVLSDYKIPPSAIPPPVLPTGERLGGPTPYVSGPFSIDGLGFREFHIKILDPIKKLSVSMITADWVSNNDLIISPVRQPKVADIIGRSRSGPDFWYGPTGTSNESLTMVKDLPQGSFVYITVINRSNTDGKFKLYWNAQ